MELGEAKTLGIFDDHKIGSRDVDPYLDHAGRDQDVGHTVAECLEMGRFLRRLHSAMHDVDPKMREDLFELGFERRDRLLAIFLLVERELNQGDDEKGLVPLLYLLVNPSETAAALARFDIVRLHGETVGGHDVEVGDIERSEQGHAEGARDRGRGHHEEMGGGGETGQE